MITVGKFNVRVVEAGDGYGLNESITHEGEPLVEFYDSRYPHTAYGQFVNRYYISTLLEHPHAGLTLDAGIPAWTIDSHDMGIVRAYLIRKQGW